MRRSVKRALGLGVAGGAAFAVWKAWNARVPQHTDGVEWSSAPFPFPPAPRPAREPAAESDAGRATPAPQRKQPVPAWVEPNADGSCPATHPIKAKMSSGIFHSPGGASYARTKPDRCYRDADAALADGLRTAKA